MGLPIRQLTNLVRSPKGQRAIRDARAKLDTPANRRKAMEAFSRLRGARRGPGRSAGT